MKKSSLKSIINTPIANLPKRYVDLYQMQKIVGKELRKRKKAFKKQGLTQAIEDVKHLRTGNTKASVLKYVAEASAFLRKSTSTVKGYKQARKNKRTAIEKLLGKKFKNYEEFDNFGESMGAMQERAGAMWDKLSAMSIELWEQAKRINLDTSMLFENYEYWMDHVKDMDALTNKEASAIKKKLKNASSEKEATDILGFENIRKYYKKVDDNARKGGKRK